MRLVSFRKSVTLGTCIVNFTLLLCQEIWNSFGIILTGYGTLKKLVSLIFFKIAINE